MGGVVRVVGFIKCNVRQCDLEVSFGSCLVTFDALRLFVEHLASWQRSIEIGCKSDRMK